jgi:hypothetical protein
MVLCHDYDDIDYIHGSNNGDMPFYRERIGATPPTNNTNSTTTKTSTSTFVNGLDRNVDIGLLVAAVDNLVLCPSRQQAAEFLLSISRYFDRRRRQQSTDKVQAVAILVVVVVVIRATTNWQGRMVEVPFKCVMQKCQT